LNTAKLKLSELQSAIIRNPITVSPMTVVSDAIAKMVKERSQLHLDSQGGITGDESKMSCVIVVEEQKVVGILTERDIVRLISQATALDHLPIREVMTHPVITLRETAFTDLLSAIHLLQNRHIRNLPLVDDQDRLTGLLTHQSLRQSLRPFDLLRLRLVSEVMNSSVTCAPPDRSMMAISQQMAAEKVSCVVIVEPMPNNLSLQIPIGILTERDIVQSQFLDLDLNNCAAKIGMSKPTVGVSADTSLWQVQQIMEQRRIRRLIVTGTQGELVGLITQSSLLQVLNPLELYSLTEILEAKVAHLEAEKATLLHNQNIELERLVTERTASLLITSEREKIVADIADRIRVSLNLPDILETCVTEVRDFLQCDRVIVYQFQEDGSGIIINESVETGFTVSLGNHIKDSCFQDHNIQDHNIHIYRQDQPILVNNIYTAGYSDCHVRLLEQYQVKANLVVPIRVSGQLWGLLIGHQCQNPRDWVIDDMRLLQNMSVQLAIAIQQANAYQQLQHELAEREKTERLFRESQRIAKLGNWTLNLQTNTLYWSGEVFRIMELDPQKLIANYETFLSMIHPEDREMVDHAYQQSLRDHLPYNIVHRLLLNDGQVKYVQEQCETFYDDDSSPILSQGTVQDITNLKQTELALAVLNNQLEERVQERTAQLLAQEEQLRDFFDNANDLIQSVRLADGSFEYVNQAWLKTLGYKQDEVKDLNIFDILHPTCQEHCRQLMSQMMINAASSLDQIELTLITKNKQIIIVEGNVNCRVELDSNHQIQPVATRAILRDITPANR
jgi:PAS domain S-box-containing protein